MIRGQANVTIASGHPKTTQAADEILRQGGNAFDAAVAAGFVSSITEPTLTSLGGGGFLLAHRVEGEEILFDFFANLPGRGQIDPKAPSKLDEVVVEFPGKSQSFWIGPTSVATPGVFPGLLHIHKRLGRLPLKEVLGPAIVAGREGVKLNRFQAYTLELLEPILTRTSPSRALFTRGSQLLKEGDLLKNLDLAAFLETMVGKKGERPAWEEVAEELHRELSGQRGVVTRDDLLSYRVEERTPQSMGYRGRTILTNPSPALGGKLLLLALERFAQHERGRWSWGTGEHLDSLAQVMREVEEMRGSDSDPEAREVSRGTTHLSIADGEGNVASMTTSNGEGSGHLIPGTGIMLNNMLGEDDLYCGPRPGEVPGERLASMMAPTLVKEGDRVILALGSGGSKRIRSAIFQVMTHMLDCSLDLGKAVTAPRLHFDGEILQVEEGVSSETRTFLEQRWRTNFWKVKDLYFGGVHAIVPGMSAIGDPRRGGDDLVRPT